MAKNLINLNVNSTDYDLRPYGVCSTAASTAAKTVALTDFNLVLGVTVVVKFSNANSASTPTLNVNNTGAKNIFSNNAQITSGANKSLLAGTVEFVYDGTQWQLIGNYIDTKNTAGSTNSSSKLFLIGATSQAANPQTYSHDTAYVGTDGCLYSNNTKVSVEGHGHSYLPLSGGTMTGPIKYTLSNNRIFGIVPDPSLNNSVDIGFNWDNGDGAGCAFRSADRGGQEGAFIVFARKNTSDTCDLVGKPNGQLTWCSNEVYHSGNLNNATASANGFMSSTDKVKLDNVEPELFTTNSTGNFDYVSNKYTTRFTNASSTTKDPYGILGGNQCMVYSCILGNIDYGGQIAFGFDKPRIAFRKRSNGAWTNWEDIASQYVVRDRGSNTVSTLSSLPIDKSIVVATVSSATNLSLSSDMNVGDSLTILGTNSSSSNITQALPNSGNWKSMDGDSLKIPAGKSFEINILCYDTNKYSISCKILA